jgi:hypothetical protein
VVRPDFKTGLNAAMLVAKAAWDLTKPPPSTNPPDGDPAKKAIYMALKSLYDQYDAVNPRVEITALPYLIGTKAQPHIIDIEVKVFGTDYFDSASIEPDLFDSGMGKVGGNVIPLRRQSPAPATSIFSNSQVSRHNTGSIDLFGNIPTAFTTLHPPNSTYADVNTTIPDESYDYRTLIDECNAFGGAGGSAFGLADWDVSFANVARSSWSFVDYGVAPPITIELDASNSTPTTASFQVHSIATTCVIKASATFVTGFFNCDRLVIEERTTPLRIIGAMILSGRGAGATNPLNIHPLAYAKGIHWSSIYQPNAIIELQTNGILKPTTSTPCATIPDDPIWHPHPSINKLSATFKCSPMSLRFGKDPFTWTMVDPDCGGTPSAPSNSCKKRAMRFILRELNRRDTI